MSLRQADLIIVGGGLMGASTAFFFASKGRSVILLERGLIGRQASGTNFGAVRRQGRPLNQLSLANRSREIWYRMPELLGEDCEFVKRGHLRIALDEASAEEMLQYCQTAYAYGLQAEVLHGPQLRERFPYLSERALLGTFAPGDGHANPRLTGPAFGRAAVRAGATVLENTAVETVAKANGDFEVVSERGERFRAPLLLLTTGAWSAAFADAFDERVPLTIKGPQMSVTEPLPYFMGSNVSVATKTHHEHVYFRQVERGNIVMGGPFWGPASIETHTAQVDPTIPLMQAREVRKLLPVAAKARIIRTWSGVESYTQDGQPIMGESPSVSGLYYAYGFSGSGFQLGPGVGHTMAELISSARTDVSLEPFLPDRFARPTTPPSYNRDGD